MRRLFCIIFTVLFTTGMGLAQWSTEEGDGMLEVNIQTPAKLFQPGESVDITVTFANLSKSPQTIFFRMPEIGDGFEMAGEDGMALPKVYVQDLMLAAITNEDFYNLEPGASRKFNIHCRVRILNDHPVFDCDTAEAIDFERPGKYTLVLVYQPRIEVPSDVLGPVWLGRTVSNSVTLEITDK